MKKADSNGPERVLHIIGRMDRAGAETMLMNYYRTLDRALLQFDFVYFTADSCDYDDEIEALGGRIHRISTSNRLKRFEVLRKLLKAGEWRFVHSHTHFSSGLYLTVAYLAGVPHRIAHAHSASNANSVSMAGRAYHWLARALLRQMSTSRVACGDAAAAYLFPGRRDVIVIPNAVDIDRFANASGAAVRSELGIRDGQLVIIQVGRFMPVKNHVRSLDIAQTLRQAGVDFQLLLVGSGPEQHRIESLRDELGLEGCVCLLGLRADIPELMAAADVMLMPSFQEGFPVVLAEAQAGGLPSVVSSAISPEVELGLGMVRFTGLEASDADWSAALQAAASAEVPEADVRRDVLEQAGFSTVSGVRRLEQVYRA